MSLPLSSEKSLDRRSSSASMPTLDKTFLTSAWEGDPPERERRRYAARCFIFVKVLGISKCAWSKM